MPERRSERGDGAGAKEHEADPEREAAGSDPRARLLERRRLLQRKARAGAPASGAEVFGRPSDARAQQRADEGTRGAGGALPHLDTIQRSFGRHDVSQVRAHGDAASADANRALGAEAFAAGDRVAFAGAPSLRVAAHEAAHVVQQRGGLERGGAEHEQHADEVADRVAQGKSSEALLDRHGGGAASPAARAPVQLMRVKGVEKSLSVKDLSDEEVKDYSSRWLRDEVTFEHEGEAKELLDRWSQITFRSENEKDDEKDDEKEDKKEEKESKEELKPKQGTFAFEKSLKKAHKLVEESPMGKKLLVKAREASEHFVVQKGDAGGTYLDFDGKQRGDLITISKDLSVLGHGRAAQQIIMELTNLSNKVRFWRLDYAVSQGKLLMKDYVLECEKIEYEGVLNVIKAHEESKDLLGKSNWEGKKVSSFDEYWKYLGETRPDHLKIYEKAWMRIKEGTDKIPPPPN